MALFTGEAVRSKVPPEQTGPELVAVTVQPEHEGGEVYGLVMVQVGSAEKVAVMLQLAPLAVMPGSV